MFDRLRDGIYASVAVVSEGVYELAFFVYSQFYYLDRYLYERPY